MAEKASFRNAQHEPVILCSDMLLSHLENKVQTKPRPSEDSAPGQFKPPALSENDIQKFGKYRLVCGGLIFIGLTVLRWQS